MCNPTQTNSSGEVRTKRFPGTDGLSVAIIRAELYASEARMALRQAGVRGSVKVYQDNLDAVVEVKKCGF